jgi:phage shock protein A
MGIFKRVKGIGLADVHSVLDKLEDPVSMLKQYIREMEAEIEKAKQALSNQLYIEKKYEVMLADTEKLINKRARQAQLAVDRNEDEIAKLALQDKIIHEHKLTKIKETFESTKKQTTLLYEQVKKLQDTYEELQQKKLALIARANAAQATHQVNQALVSFSPDNAVKGFTRMEEQILHLEAKACANQQVYELTRPQSSAYHNQALEQEVEQELAKLKQVHVTI